MWIMGGILPCFVSSKNIYSTPNVFRSNGKIGFKEIVCGSVGFNDDFTECKSGSPLPGEHVECVSCRQHLGTILTPKKPETELPSRVQPQKYELPLNVPVPEPHPHPQSLIPENAHALPQSSPIMPKNDNSKQPLDAVAGLAPNFPSPVDYSHVYTLEETHQNQPSQSPPIMPIKNMPTEAPTPPKPMSYSMIYSSNIPTQDHPSSPSQETSLGQAGLAPSLYEPPMGNALEKSSKNPPEKSSEIDQSPTIKYGDKTFEIEYKFSKVRDIEWQKTYV